MIYLLQHRDTRTRADVLTKTSNPKHTFKKQCDADLELLAALHADWVVQLVMNLQSKLGFHPNSTKITAHVALIHVLL